MTLRFTLLITLLTLSSKIFAGTGGPDTWGYTWKDSDEPSGPSYNWIDILNYNTAAEVKLLGDDNSKGPFNLNFNFHYYWYDVNQFYVGSNGYILFEQGQIAAPFYALPSIYEPYDVVGAFMNDLTFFDESNPGECWYWINDGLDTLIVSWVNVPFWYNYPPYYSGSNSFQIILSAVDSSITFQYQEQQGSAYASGFTQVGIQNYSGNIGLSWNSVFPGYINPPTEYAIKFYQPTNPTLQVTDAAMIYNDEPGTKGIFVVQSNNAHELVAETKNSGTTNVNPYNINAQVVNPSNLTVVNENFTTDTLLSGETQDITFASTFQPAIAGTYQFVTTSQLTGDINLANNLQRQEIVSIDTNQTEMRLGYDDGQVYGLFGLQWVGGYASEAVHFIPPIYPVAITKVHIWISSNFYNAAFSTRIMADDGAFGLPFTLLDSIYVASNDIVINGWTDVELATPIIISSGGFYVSWDMQGEFITLGMASEVPLAHRGFEAGHNDWGTSRFDQFYDPMINATIEHYSYPVGVPAVDGDALQLQVFPNPCNDEANFIYNLPGNGAHGELHLFDVHGREAKAIDLGAGNGTHQLKLNCSDLSNGVYFAELISGKEKVMQKVVVVK